MLRDLKIAFRHLSKSPGFSLTAVLTLAFGIGATTAIFSIVEGVLLRPLLSRLHTQQEDDAHEPVTVLSYATWQSRFQGDSAILGRKILLDRKPYVVIGVMPHNFEFPLFPGHLNRSELWIPMSLQPAELAGSEQGFWSFNLVGRLKPGVTSALAREDADRVAQQTMRNYPAFMADLHISPIVRGLHEDIIAQARPLSAPSSSPSPSCC